MSSKIAIWRLAAQLPDRTAACLEPVELSPQPHSLDETSTRLPGGAYTTFRTFGRQRVMRLSDHFYRLEETARLAGFSIQLDRERITAALGQALAAYPAAEARVRLTLDLQQDPGAVYIEIETLRKPGAHDYQRGVCVVTRKLQRENPKAKLTGFIEKASAIRQSLQQGISEALMVGPDGRVLEGLSSNFFAIKDGAVWTAEQGVLSGITRSLVLEAINDIGIPLVLEGISVSELDHLEEAFITSASRAVLPVREIDGRVVGYGHPGPLTNQLAVAYQAKVQERLETVGEIVQDEQSRR